MDDRDDGDVGPPRPTADEDDVVGPTLPPVKRRKVIRSVNALCAEFGRTLNYRSSTLVSCQGSGVRVTISGCIAIRPDV